MLTFQTARFRRFQANLLCLAAGFCLCWGSVAGTCQAERFTIVDGQGQQREIVGRLHGSGQGAYAIQKPGGELELVAQGAVIARDNTVDWQAATPQEMAEQLRKEFGADTFRGYVEGNFVIGMVLMDAIPKQSEIRVTGFLKKAARFMNNVETVFLKFTTDLRLPTREAEVPLVLLIFESDDDFNAYTETITEGKGLSSRNIAGFYNGITNYLAIRMTECTTFEVPLHEAIHQQVYNRGILQRLAPIPSWFNEGIAAGFEANGDRINNGPTKVHGRYSRQYQTAAQVTWSDLITDDLAFQGDVLAGDAYCHAWALHWLLVNNHKQAYAGYVKRLSEKLPLSKPDPATRQADFEEFFGADLNQLKSEFAVALQKALRTQRYLTEKPTKAGYLRVQQSLADLEMTATARLDRGGLLEIEGQMQNINPFRNLSFLVNVVTDGGTYAQWTALNVPPNRKIPLPQKYVSEVLPGSSGQGSRAFHVRIRSVHPESPDGLRWQRGELSPPSP